MKKINVIGVLWVAVVATVFAIVILAALGIDIPAGPHVVGTAYCPMGLNVVAVTLPVDCLEVCGVAVADAATVTGTAYCPDGLNVVTAYLPIDCLETCGAEMPAEMMRY